MSIFWIVLIVLLLTGGLGSPMGPWDHGYGWGPSGIVVLLIVLVLIFGRGW